jgi:hypothetical protein
VVAALPRWFFHIAIDQFNYIAGNKSSSVRRDPKCADGDCLEGHYRRGNAWPDGLNDDPNSRV